MQLATLDVSKKQAAEAVIHYRRALKLHRNAEDEAILRGYQQILRGHKLISGVEVIKAGGEDTQHRPLLAISRADLVWCHLLVEQDGQVQYGDGQWRRRHPASLKEIRLPAGTIKPWTDQRGNWFSVRSKALVPTIPPQYRPPHHLSNYHILFEAEWTQEPPRDPALLKHLGGDLWAVLALWNLTELERAVLSGRRTQ